MFLMQRCHSFPLQARQHLWKNCEERSGARKSQRLPKKEILSQFLDDCINFVLLGKDYFLLVYCICSSRVTKNMRIIICEVACDPGCFFLSFNLANLKNFLHYCQILLAAKKINAANHLLLTGKLQVFPTGRVNKYFLYRVTVCFHWVCTEKCR